MRHAAGLATLLIVAAATLPNCEERPADNYEDAGERLDAAIERVEQLKRDLREAEQELRLAQAAMEKKVEAGPERAEDVPALPPE